MSFTNLGLCPQLLNAVVAKGYKEPTLIQAEAIPPILSGQDILARAQTGTGKTDAFVLPLLEILSRQQRRGREPAALVLTPTRELALQVGECVKAYARRLSLRCTVVYGGVRIEPQVDRLKRGVDILVATPGRLLDLISLRAARLSSLKFLIFDEADRMLDMGFSEEISTILDFVPSKRQTMLFSATYSQQVRDLAAVMLDDPQFIEVSPDNSAAEAVSQKVHLIDRSQKLALLVCLLKKRRKGERTLVFTRTRHGANRLVDNLAAKGIKATALHGNKSQSVRIRTLKEFKSGTVQTLIATDIAARGLDIHDLPHVVNYDMPEVPEDYIHRIGRTGRAGTNGVAVSLVCREERPHLQVIEALLGLKIPVEKVDGYTEDSDVPNFVLYRPNSSVSEKKADQGIKDLWSERDRLKQQAQAKRTAAPTRKKAKKGKAKEVRKPAKPGKKGGAEKKLGYPW